MIAQDTNFNVKVILPEGDKVGTMKLQHNNGNVSLAFYKEVEQAPGASRTPTRRTAQIPDMTYQLVDFTSLERNASDTQILELSGPRSEFNVRFSKEIEVNNFLDYISQKVTLRNSPYKSNAFIFESHSIAGKTGLPFIPSNLPKVRKDDNQAYRRISKSNIKAIDLLSENIPPPIPLNEEEFSDLFNEDGSIKDESGSFEVFYNREISPALLGKVLTILNDKDQAKLTEQQRKDKANEDLGVYKSIKMQWKTVSPQQWNNHIDLQILIKGLEGDLFAHEDMFDNKLPVLRLAFNILLTLSYWSWDKAMYKNGMIEFLAPFIKAYVTPEMGESLESLSRDELDALESQIFWTFERFYLNNNIYEVIHKTSQPTLKNILENAGVLLRNSYRDILELYEQKHVFSLCFFQEDFSHWFANIFSGADLLRLWISAFACNSTSQFYTAFFVAVLYELSPDLTNLVSLNSKNFEKFYQAHKTDLAINSLLANTQKILSLIHEE